MKITNLAMVAVLGLGMSAVAQSSGSDSAGTQGGATSSSNMGGQTGSMKSDAKGKGMDMKFAKMAAAGGLAEVQTAQIALKNSQNDQVKQFAQKMIDDHTKANDDLKQVAAKDNITLPTEPMPKDKAEAAKLEKLQGPAFDKEYVKYALKDHQMDSKEFKQEASSGQNPDIKDFAAKYSPIIDQHLQMVQGMSGSMASGKSSKPSPSGSGQ